jgi:predicted nucleotidyltransferase/biotin operon repressor
MEDYSTMARLGEKVKIEIFKLFGTGYDKEYHLRELARELDMDHTSVRPHLDSLKEQTVIKEEKQGRNKVFSLNQKSDLLPYYLTQAEADRTAGYLENNNAIRVFWKNFRDRVKPETLREIETLVLFGSFAKGTEKKESDIDLFLAAPDKPSSEIMDICEKLESVTGRDIEIEQTSEFRNLIAHKGPGTLGEIVSNHVVLLGIEMFVYTTGGFYGG